MPVFTGAHHSGRFSVERCDSAIATISAPDLSSLAFGQGFVTASDRPWQLAVDFWRSQGNISSFLGPDHEEIDALIRRVDVEFIAQDSFSRATLEAQEFAKSYAEGVNEALSASLAEDPAAQKLGISAVAPWEPWRPIAMLLLAHVLFGAFPETLWREHVRRVLGPSVSRLWNGAPAESAAGSNAWFVPRRFVSEGVPLLCADPHRLLEFPGPYQQVRLRAPGIRADGLSFPGFPGIPHFGQTAQAAWVVTNAMADSQPLYRLRQNPEGCAQNPEGSMVLLQDEEGPLVLAWSPALTGDAGLETSMRLLYAQNAQDILEAFERWIDPVDDVLAADSTDTAFRFTAGKVQAEVVADARRRRSGEDVPLREKGAGTGPSSSVPSSAAPSLSWLRFTPKPLTSYEASANEHRPDSPTLGVTYCSPARRNRIMQRLEEMSGAEPKPAQDYARIALDTLDSGLKEHIHRLLSPLREIHKISGESLTQAQRERLEDLLSWDGHFEAKSRGAALAALWRQELVLHLAEHPVFLPLKHRPYQGEFSALFAPWMNPIARIGLNLNRILEQAAPLGIDSQALALRALRNLPSQKEDIPEWSVLHRALPLSSGPVDLEGLDMGIGGDTDCVLSAGSVPGVFHHCLRAPVARVLWHVGSPEDSSWIVPWGSLGGHHREHRADQSKDWAAGQLRKVMPGEHKS